MTGFGKAWTDEIQVTAADGSTGPVDGPWTIEIDGAWTIEIDGGAMPTVNDPSGTLVLAADSSGTIALADGSELTFDGVESILW